MGENDKSNNLAASLNPATNTTKSKDDTTSEHNGMESTLPLTERGLGPGGVLVAGGEIPQIQTVPVLGWPSCSRYIASL